MSNEYREKGSKVKYAILGIISGAIVAVAGFGYTNSCTGNGCVGKRPMVTNTDHTDETGAVAINSFETTTPVETTTLAEKETEVSTSYDDIAIYVNDEVYNMLKKAKNDYHALLDQGGKVSEKLSNNGIKMNKDVSNQIDGLLPMISSKIDKYVSSYEKKDFNTCYSVYRELDDYYSAVSKDYLYSLLVASKLDSDYQSNMKRDESGYLSYSSGDINLNNGRQIRFIGGIDEFIDDNADNEIAKVNWISSIPRVLFYKYAQYGVKDNVCYIINETRVNDLCSSETSRIISESSSEYGYDVKTTSIKGVNGEYCFVGNDNTLYGTLDYNQKSSYDLVSEVKDAVKTHKYDPLEIDGYVYDMYNNQSDKSYNK